MIRTGMAIALVCFSTFGARADCKDEIRKLFDLRSAMSGMRAIVETEVQGKVIQTAKAAYQDYRHNMFEVVGRNWWSMLYGDTHYNSSDGKTWKKSGTQDPDWEKKAAEGRESIISTMTDVACGETKEIDGKVYKVYRYSYKAEKPYPTDTDNVIYLNDADGFVFRSVVLSKGAVATRLTTTYSRDPGLRIPRPE